MQLQLNGSSLQLYKFTCNGSVPPPPIQVNKIIPNTDDGTANKEKKNNINNDNQNNANTNKDQDTIDNPDEKLIADDSSGSSNIYSAAILFLIILIVSYVIW